MLVHDRQDGLHAAMLHQVRLVANQYQRQPEVNGARGDSKGGKGVRLYFSVRRSLVDCSGEVAEGG